MTYEQSRVCPHCGKEISARATRCKYCLEQVTAIPPEPLPSRSPIETALASEPAVPRPTPAVATTSPARCQYRYHVVPFIGAMKSGFFSGDNAQTVSAQLNGLIDHYALQGWEFYSLEKVDIQITPGCIGQLLGQNASYITFDKVIFRQAA